MNQYAHQRRRHPLQSLATTAPEGCNCDAAGAIAAVLRGDDGAQPCRIHQPEEFAEFERVRIRRITDEFHAEYDSRMTEADRIAADPFRTSLAAATSRNRGTGLGLTSTASDISRALGLGAEPTTSIE